MMNAISCLGCEPCETPCIRCEDNYDRSDNTNVETGQPSGCSGTEDAGSWDIEGNTLRVVANANARIRMVTNTSSASIVIGNVQVKIHGTASGDKAVIVLLGAGDFLTLTIEAVFGGSLIIRSPAGVYYVEGGSVPVNTWFTVSIRLQLGEASGTSSVCVSLDGVPVVSSMLSVTTSTAAAVSFRHVQLGTGNVCTGTVRFDDFVAREFNVAAVGTGECVRPFGCGWPAQLVLPDTIYALISGATPGSTTSPPCSSGVCSSLDGLYTLSRVTVATAAECARYEQTGLNFICQHCTNAGTAAATKAVLTFRYQGSVSPYVNPYWALIFTLGENPQCILFVKAHQFGDINHTVPNPLDMTANDTAGADADARCDTDPSKVTLYT